jgi:hypothetical protein
VGGFKGEYRFTYTQIVRFVCFSFMDDYKLARLFKIDSGNVILEQTNNLPEQLFILHYFKTSCLKLRIMCSIWVEEKYRKQRTWFHFTFSVTRGRGWWLYLEPRDSSSSFHFLEGQEGDGCFLSLVIAHHDFIFGGTGG